MQPEQFDKRVKNAFEGKRISPSPDAWEALERQLDAAPKKKNTPLFWMAAAIAVIVAGAFAYQMLLPAGIADETTTPVADFETENFSQPEVGIPHPELSIAVDSANDPVQPVDLNSRSRVRVQQYTVNMLTAEDQLVYMPVSSAGESEVYEVSEKEIDALLAKVEAQITTPDATGAELLKAMALLEQVEAELDQSFKEKALEKLRQGFVKFRTAVAEKNR